MRVLQHIQVTENNVTSLAIPYSSSIISVSSDEHSPFHRLVYLYDNNDVMTKSIQAVAVPLRGGYIVPDGFSFVCSNNLVAVFVHV